MRDCCFSSITTKINKCPECIQGIILSSRISVRAQRHHKKFRLLLKDLEYKEPSVVILNQGCALARFLYNQELSVRE